MKKIRKEVILGFEGYEIDELGEVFSLPRVVNKGKSTYTVKGGKLKKVIVATYNCVYLYKDGVMTRRYVTSLMRDAFLKIKNERKEVNHINCNRLDDRLVNLEMMSRSENVQHSYDVCRKEK